MIKAEAPKASELISSEVMSMADSSDLDMTPKIMAETATPASDIIPAIDSTMAPVVASEAAPEAAPIAAPEAEAPKLD